MLFEDLRGFQNLAGLMLMLSVLLFSMPVHAEPGLLWKKTFDSRIVKTTRLTDFQLKKGKGGDFPLKAVMTEKSIFVLDHRGKIEKRISLEEFTITMEKNGQFKHCQLKQRLMKLLEYLILVYGH